MAYGKAWVLVKPLPRDTQFSNFNIRNHYELELDPWSKCTIATTTITFWSQIWRLCLPGHLKLKLPCNSRNGLSSMRVWEQNNTSLLMLTWTWPFFSCSLELDLFYLTKNYFVICQFQKFHTFFRLKVPYKRCQDQRCKNCE